jgi:hypothetical protein
VTDVAGIVNLAQSSGIKSIEVLDTAQRSSS